MALPVFLALLLIVSMAGAQTLHGTVMGEGKALAGATVRVPSLDRVEVSGAGGHFTFSDLPKGTYRVFVSLVGYASAAQSVEVSGDSATVAFELKPSAIPMPEVVVSGSPYPRPADEQYQPVEAKSQVEFLNSAGSSYADKISDIPGVTVRGNGPAPSRPILRGLSDNRVLILENGLRTGDIATYDPAHATPIEAIGVSEIDVVRGPATILYGPSTIGGLVNVHTHILPAVSDHALSGTATVEGNSVSDQYAGYFDAIYSSGHQAFRASMGGLHSQDIRIPAGTYTDPGSGVAFDLNRMPQSFDHSEEAGLGYAYQGDFGSIGVGAKHYGMNYGIPGVPPNADWEEVPPATSRIMQRRNTYELRGLFNSGGSFIRQWKLNANYNDYHHSEFPTAQDSTGVSDPQANHFHKRAFNADLQFQHAAYGKWEGTYGLWSNIENLTIDGDQPLGPNSLTTGFAAYLFEEYMASADTRMQFGVRFDYNKIQTNPAPSSTDSVFQTLDVNQSTNAVTASLGAIQRFTPELTGSFSVARSFRAPTVQELFANGLDAPSGTYSIGTATLGPESGIGVDASLRGSYQNFAFELSPFVNLINDYIYGFLRGDTIQDFPVRQFAATDARLFGFEAGVTIQAAPRLALKATSDYVNAQDTKLDVPLPFTPPLRGLVRATYQDDRYMGTAEVRLAASQNRLGDGDTPTDGYAVVNVGAGLRLPQNGVVHNIGLHCDNLFNTVYRDNLSVIKDFIPQPARAVRLNYTVTF